MGAVWDVLVERFDEERGEFVGHTQHLSPNVDFGVRFVDNGSVKVRSNVKVRIVDFDGADFKGEVL